MNYAQGTFVTMTNLYIYKGDRLTDNFYKNRECNAVRRSDGKCIRGKNGNMLVEVEGKRIVVLGRQLRKVMTSVQLKS